MFGSISRKQHDDLVENGEHAEAVVLEAKLLTLAGAPIRFAKMFGGVRPGTGTHAYTAHLRVEPEGGEAFEIKQRLRIPESTPCEAGTRLAVVFDPDDHSKLVLDPDSWQGSKARRA
ncbi:MAG: hypothetical protein QOD60_2110 [Solirubrobacterales bacterium]|nr:hypothetical protein [Solirubrobacterales bacterium]